MISQTSLLKALEDDLRVCDSAHHESDAKGRQGQILEHATLLNHFTWTQRARQNQEELEKILQSLEANGFVAGYQHWRELAVNRRP